MEEEKSSGQPAMTNSSTMTLNVKTREKNRGDAPSVTNNLANGTVTIVVERSKPLILKLCNPQHGLFGLGSAKKPQDDIEKMVDELGDELIEYVSQSIYTIRDETKRARPQPGEDNYEMKMEAYRKLLAFVTEMINRLKTMFTESLTEYRRLIDQYWIHLQAAQNDNEREAYTQQFLEQSSQNFRDAIKKNIEPLIESVQST